MLIHISKLDSYHTCSNSHILNTLDKCICFKVNWNCIESLYDWHGWHHRVHHIKTEANEKQNHDILSYRIMSMSYMEFLSVLLRRLFCTVLTGEKEKKRRRRRWIGWYHNETTPYICFYTNFWLHAKRGSKFIGIRLIALCFLFICHTEKFTIEMNAKKAVVGLCSPAQNNVLYLAKFIFFSLLIELDRHRNRFFLSRRTFLLF